MIHSWIGKASTGKDARRVGHHGGHAAVIIISITSSIRGMLGHHRVHIVAVG